MEDPDTILLEAEEAMTKAIDYYTQELRGIRTGRASAGLVEYLKVDYYGSPTDLKSLASISIPEPTQLLIKPFDPSSLSEIRRTIENSGLGLNPNVEDKQIRLNIPPLSRERREQLVTRVKKMGEEIKVVLRNARRDANKHADALAKAEQTSFSEDEIKTLKEEIQELLKQFESRVDDMTKRKADEVMEV